MGVLGLTLLFTIFSKLRETGTKFKDIFPGEKGTVVVISIDYVTISEPLCDAPTLGQVYHFLATIM